MGGSARWLIIPRPSVSCKVHPYDQSDQTPSDDRPLVLVVGQRLFFEAELTSELMDKF